MSIIKSKARINIHSLVTGFMFTLIFNCPACKGDHRTSLVSSANQDKTKEIGKSDESVSVPVLLVLPKNPCPGKAFRILATGEKMILKSKIIVTGASGTTESVKSKAGVEFPFWRIDDFNGLAAGKYKVTLIEDKKEISNLEITISTVEEIN